MWWSWSRMGASVRQLLSSSWLDVLQGCTLSHGICFARSQACCAVLCCQHKIALVSVGCIDTQYCCTRTHAAAFGCVVAGMRQHCVGPKCPWVADMMDVISSLTSERPALACCPHPSRCMNPSCCSFDLGVLKLWLKPLGVSEEQQHVYWGSLCTLHNLGKGYKAAQDKTPGGPTGAGLEALGKHFNFPRESDTHLQSHRWVWA